MNQTHKEISPVFALALCSVEHFSIFQLVALQLYCFHCHQSHQSHQYSFLQQKAAVYSEKALKNQLYATYLALDSRQAQ